MAFTPFNQLMAHARWQGYATGYFECWNLESALAVADAAEATRSPVLLGFSGIYLPHPARLRPEPAGLYAALGLEVCRHLSVPASLVFNESPYPERVLQAIREGYGLVMFSDEDLAPDEQIAQVREIAAAAHREGVAVEGEVMALPGIHGNLLEMETCTPLTEIEDAREFVRQTGVDAFAVNVGQMHLHGRQEVRLDLERLEELHQALDLPLVLHGASSVNRQDIVRAISLGICKINVSSILKQTYFEAMRAAAADTPEGYNPYEVLGSGLENDVLMAGRLALQRKVEELMQLFGSAGKADSFS